MSPKDKKNYVVGWYERAKTYRTWRDLPIKSRAPRKIRTYSFEVNKNNIFLIPENKRKIRIITAQSKEAKKRGGQFPGQSDVFFGSSNEVYIYELKKKLKLSKLECDIEEIESSKEITETERQRLISTRVGQGIYRKELIDYWEHCPVSKCDDISLLRASHIKPWSASNNEERLNVYNGLLLSPNIDILFDKGLISFSNDGNIIISRNISIENIKRLGVNKNIKISLSIKHIPFLEWHRKYISS